MFDMTSDFLTGLAFHGLDLVLLADVASLTMISEVAKVNPSCGCFLFSDADVTQDLTPGTYYIWERLKGVMPSQLTGS